MWIARERADPERLDGGIRRSHRGTLGTAISILIRVAKSSAPSRMEFRLLTRHTSEALRLRAYASALIVRRTTLRRVWVAYGSRDCTPPSEPLSSGKGKATACVSRDRAHVGQEETPHAVSGDITCRLLPRADVFLSAASRQGGSTSLNQHAAVRVRMPPAPTRIRACDGHERTRCGAKRRPRVFRGAIVPARGQ